MLYKIITIILISGFLFQPAANAGRFSDACEWMNMNPGPRDAGIGVSFYGISRGANAGLFNPAAPAMIEEREIKASHGVLLSGLTYDSLAYLEPEAGKGSASILIRRFGTDRMTKIRQGVIEDEFQTNDIAVNLGYGHLLMESLGFGINLKGIQSKLDEISAQTVGGDAGVFGSPFKNTFLGAAVHNISAPLYYRNEAEKLPFYISLGVSRHLNLSSENVDLAFALGAKYMDYEEWEIGVGVEHTAFDQFSLRAGYQYNTNDRKLKFPANFSAGLGINVSGTIIDYAWVPFGEMGTTHRFGLGYRFESEKKEKIKEISIEVSPGIFSPEKEDATINVKWVNVGKIEKWTMNIRDINGIIVRKIAGEGKPDAIMWDGKEEHGSILMDGSYTVRLVAFNKRGERFVSNKDEIITDSTPPDFEMKLSDKRFSPNGDGRNDKLRIEISGSDNNMMDSYTVKIFNKAEKKVKEFTGQHFPDEIIWDGTDDYYEEVVSSGEYELLAQAKDIVGNTTLLKRKVVEVYIPPKVVTKKIKVTQEERGLKINLTSKVLFDSGKSSLKSASHDSLNEVVRVLKAYPDNMVSIEGHTDSVGSAQYNEKLSLQRAKAVRNYLVSTGIDSDRIKTVGWGEEKPVATNKTREGRAANRRVEIIVLREKQSK
ncbi:MAG: PorV/PorQ family protein [Elusimicrobiota bacterium]